MEHFFLVSTYPFAKVKLFQFSLVTVSFFGTRWQKVKFCIIQKNSKVKVNFLFVHLCLCCCCCCCCFQKIVKQWRKSIGFKLSNKMKTISAKKCKKTLIFFEKFQQLSELVNLFKKLSVSPHLRGSLNHKPFLQSWLFLRVSQCQSVLP